MIMQLNEIYRLQRNGNYWRAEEVCEDDDTLTLYRPITEPLSTAEMWDYLADRDATGRILKQFTALCG